VKPRVLQLIGSFHNGGSERQAVGLTRLLKEDASVAVSVAVLNNEGSLRPEIDELDLGEIPEFPLTSFFRPSFVRQTRSLAEHLRREKIDLIHTHDFYTNVIGMAAAATAGTFARVASKRETEGVRTKGQDRVERLAFGASSKIVVNSAAVQEHLIQRGVKDSRLELIHNGVDVGVFEVAASRSDEVRRELDLPEDTKLVTVVANLRHDVKNIPMFLRAADRASQRVSNATFVIAGEGERKVDLEAMAVQLGIEQFVYFVGRCDDVPGLLAASSVCVLPSKAEGFSNSVLEYMAAGKPVVVTAVGGAAEAVVEDETGHLVDSDDDEAMAERIIELLRDRDKATQFGAAARERVRAEFSTDRQLRQTLDLYKRLLAD
jgi:glycosyltransferase involved in cell wall biosynthesis